MSGCLEACAETSRYEPAPSGRPLTGNYRLGYGGNMNYGEGD
jgi:hypothetical protein